MLEEVLGGRRVQCQAVVSQCHARIQRRSLGQELAGIMGPKIFSQGASLHILLPSLGRGSSDRNLSTGCSTLRVGGAGADKENAECQACGSRTQSSHSLRHETLRSHEDVRRIEYEVDRWPPQALLPALPKR